MRTPDRQGAAPKSTSWGLGQGPGQLGLVPRTTVGPESRYVFRFGSDGGWVLPSGFGSGPLLSDTRTRGRSAVGGVLIDPAAGTALVRFAATTPGAREPACDRFAEWAVAAAWRLTVVDGIHPVRPYPGRCDVLACLLCGRQRSPAATSMQYVRVNAWTVSFCRTCDGHVRPVRTPA